MSKTKEIEKEDILNCVTAIENAIVLCHREPQNAKKHYGVYKRERASLEEYLTCLVELEKMGCRDWER